MRVPAVVKAWVAYIGSYSLSVFAEYLPHIGEIYPVLSVITPDNLALIPWVLKNLAFVLTVGFTAWQWYTGVKDRAAKRAKLREEVRKGKGLLVIIGLMAIISSCSVFKKAEQSIIENHNSQALRDTGYTHIKTKELSTQRVNDSSRAIIQPPAIFMLNDVCDTLTGRIRELEFLLGEAMVTANADGNSLSVECPGSKDILRFKESNKELETTNRTLKERLRESEERSHQLEKYQTQKTGWGPWWIWLTAIVSVLLNLLMLRGYWVSYLARKSSTL